METGKYDVTKIFIVPNLTKFVQEKIVQLRKELQTVSDNSPNKRYKIKSGKCNFRNIYWE